MRGEKRRGDAQIAFGTVFDGRAAFLPRKLTGGLLCGRPAPASLRLNRSLSRLIASKCGVAILPTATRLYIVAQGQVAVATATLGWDRTGNSAL
jgi:hypothetical protein